MEEIIYLDSLQNIEKQSITDSVLNISNSLITVPDRNKNKQFHVENIFVNYENFEEYVDDKDEKNLEKNKKLLTDGITNKITRFIEDKSKNKSTVTGNENRKDTREGKEAKDYKSIYTPDKSQNDKSELHRSEKKEEYFKSKKTQLNLNKNEDNEFKEQSTPPKDFKTNTPNFFKHNTQDILVQELRFATKNKITNVNNGETDDESSFIPDLQDDERELSKEKKFKVILKNVYEISIVNTKTSFSDSQFNKEIMIIGDYEIEKITSEENSFYYNNNNNLNQNNKNSEFNTNNNNMTRIKREKGVLFLNLERINQYDFCYYTTEKYINAKIEKFINGKYESNGTSNAFNNLKKSELTEIRNLIVSSNRKIKQENSFLKIINILDSLYNSIPKLIERIDQLINSTTTENFLAFTSILTLQNVEDLEAFFYLKLEDNKVKLKHSKLNNLIDTVIDSFNITLDQNSIRAKMNEGAKDSGPSQFAQYNHKENTGNLGNIGNLTKKSVINHFVEENKIHLRLISEKMSNYSSHLVTELTDCFNTFNTLVNQFDLINIAELKSCFGRKKVGIDGKLSTKSLNNDFTIFSQFEYIYKEMNQNLVVSKSNSNNNNNNRNNIGNDKAKINSVNSQYKLFTGLFFYKLNKFLYKNFAKCCSRLVNECFNETVICFDCKTFVCEKCFKYHFSHKQYDLIEGMQYQHFNNIEGYDFSVFPKKNFSKDEEKADYLNLLSDNPLYFIAKQYVSYNMSIDSNSNINNNSLNGDKVYFSKFVEILILEKVYKSLKKIFFSKNSMLSSNNTTDVKSIESLKVVVNSKLTSFLENLISSINTDEVKDVTLNVKSKNIFNKYLFNNALNYKKDQPRELIKRNRLLMSQLIANKLSAEFNTSQSIVDKMDKEQVSTKLENVISMNLSPKKMLIDGKINGRNIFSKEQFNFRFLSRYNSSSITTSANNTQKLFDYYVSTIRSSIKSCIDNNTLVMRVKDITNNYYVVKEYLKVLFENKKIIPNPILSDSFNNKIRLINAIMKGALSTNTNNAVNNIFDVRKQNNALSSNVNLISIDKNKKKNISVVSENEKLHSNISNIYYFLLEKELFEAISMCFSYFEANSTAVVVDLLQKNDSLNKSSNDFFSSNLDFSLVFLKYLMKNVFAIGTPLYKAK